MAFSRVAGQRACASPPRASTKRPCGQHPADTILFLSIVPSSTSCDASCAPRPSLLTLPGLHAAPARFCTSSLSSHSVLRSWHQDKEDRRRRHWIFVGSFLCGPFADMLRRLASLGHQAHEDQEPMPPSPGDELQSPEPRSGGLAGVFRLAGGRLAKSPPPLPTIAFQDRPDAVTHPPSVVHGLSPEQIEQLTQLKSGTLNDRVAAANSLRYSIADFPLNPVRTQGVPHDCALF